MGAYRASFPLYLPQAHCILILLNKANKEEVRRVARFLFNALPTHEHQAPNNRYKSPSSPRSRELGAVSHFPGVEKEVTV